MNRTVIQYGSRRTGLQKKAIALLSELLLDYTVEYPVCLPASEPLPEGECLRIVIGTKADNPILAKESDAVLTKPEEYAIRVKSGVIFIEGFDDAGVVYGCMDFYNKYLVKLEYPDDDRFCIQPFDHPFPDFSHQSAPAVKSRGIWTWGHVIYDWRGFIDNMVKLKMNTLIIWNDAAPVNADDIVSYAHENGIRLIWGFAWCWDTNCARFDLNNLDGQIDEIAEKYEREYASIGGDGIYFQSFTELGSETIGGVLIAEAVTDFVNRTAARLWEKHPGLELQFGLHATSVRERLDYIRNVDPRIRIVWENCGSFPFWYVPTDIGRFDETRDFVKRIANLRGEDDCFGAVTKGLTKLDWSRFRHPDGPRNIGVSSEHMKDNRITRKNKYWTYIQAGWITHGEYACEMIRTMIEAKKGNLAITPLIEDGMFERTVMYPAALCAELLWDSETDYREIAMDVALRGYVTFA